MATHSSEADTGTIQVSIGTLGGTLKQVILNQGATVADALEAGGYPASSEVRCGGETYSGADMVDNGDTLVVVAGAKVEGAGR